MDEIKTKQQVVEKIKEASKILVTVSNSPSVDELSAALALTLILDKQEKYATAIFSGETPPAIAFLEPEKTFDDTTDSLRDFIIALNKEKADHLRYKVVEDAVKIFITPYKTTIDENDLEFSQGDYNVELVIALGVDNQDHLDKALEDHGQILHDAAIITMTAGDQTSTLGGIDWHDSNSSSLSEMVAGLAEALKVDKKKSLLDAPIATALLTGIVAETDRFSNERTTSKAMTVAGVLMSAGADQQLIANELQASEEISQEEAQEQNDDSDSSDSSDDSSENDDVEIDRDSDDGSMSIKKSHDSTTLSVSHEGETLADLDRRVLGDRKAKKKVVAEVAHAEEEAAEAEAKDEAREEAEDVAEEVIAANVVPEAPVEDAAPEAVAPEDVAPEAPAYEAPQEPVFELTPAPVVEAPQEGAIGSAYAAEQIGEEPTLGGTLNATTEQAADDARRDVASDQNRTILSHAAYLGNETAAPASAYAPTDEQTPEGFPGAPSVAPGSVGVNGVATGGELHSVYASDDPASPATAPSQAAALGGQRVIQPLDEAPAAQEPIVSAYAPVDTSAYAPAPEPLPAEPTAAFAPIPAPVPATDATPADLGLPLPPPIPDFSQVNAGAMPPAFPAPSAQQPAILGDILAPEPQPYAQPEAPAYAPQPEQQQPYAAPAESVAQIPPMAQPVAADPGQFQIPSPQ